MNILRFPAAAGIGLADPMCPEKITGGTYLESQSSSFAQKRRLSLPGNDNITVVHDFMTDVRRERPNFVKACSYD